MFEDRCDLAEWFRMVDMGYGEWLRMGIIRENG